MADHDKEEPARDMKNGARARAPLRLLRAARRSNGKRAASRR